MAASNSNKSMSNNNALTTKSHRKRKSMSATIKFLRVKNGENRHQFDELWQAIEFREESLIRIGRLMNAYGRIVNEYDISNIDDCNARGALKNTLRMLESQTISAARLAAAKADFKAQAGSWI